MNDNRVLRLAADVLQRKAETIIDGCVGRTFDPIIADSFEEAGEA